MATRIHGAPGHLIIDAWPSNSRRQFGFHGEAEHSADAAALFAWLHRHVSWVHTIKLLYFMLKEQFPEWDEQYQAWLERRNPNS